MTNAAFVIPGDINLPTGGYGYDRQVMARLGAHGVAVRHVALPGSFPYPASKDVETALDALASLPVDTVLLVDGLAYGALPSAVLDRIRQPIVALCHHPLALENGISEAAQIAFRASERAALHHALHVIVPSTVTRQILIGQFDVPESKITVAEPGTDRADRAIGRDVTQSERFHMLAVGSVVPRKGYAVLVEALAGLSVHNWTLTIVGAARDATTLEALQAQIKAANLCEQIVLAGAQPDGALNELYGRADMFVMPSLFEGYGMVLGEAMARGLPIVCTTGGAAAHTAPDAAALKVAPGEPAQLRSALERVLGDETLRRQMAEASWTAGLSLPTWDDTTKHISVVLSAIGRTHHGTLKQ